MHHFDNVWEVIQKFDDFYEKGTVEVLNVGKSETFHSLKAEIRDGFKVVYYTGKKKVTFYATITQYELMVYPDDLVNASYF